MRHFLDLAGAGGAGLRRILDEAHRRKAARAGLPRGAPDADAPLAGHVLAMIFEKPSTRTRFSFDAAIRQLGGASIISNAGDMQLGRGETVADTARVLSRFVDAVMLRTGAPAILAEFAAHATVPVINGLTDAAHPTQALADVMTAEERLGRPVTGSRWAWLGDGNNMANSLIEAAALLGFTLRLAVPEGHDPAPSGDGPADIVRDPAAAVGGADIVVTDCWVSMGEPDSAAKLAAMRPYQVTPELMARAAPHATFLHCLPAHRGEEVVDAVIDGPTSAVWDEAENRLHIQKAILLWCLDKLPAA